MKKKSSPKKQTSNRVKVTDLKSFWKFLWYDDSMLSWALNIILAFIFIKFLLFPGLGFAFQSELPIVAVVSGSMEHKMVHPCYQYVMDGICAQSDKTSYEICGRSFIEKDKVDLDTFWSICGGWYAEKNITKSEFADYPFKKGFNIGDVMFIYGKSFEKVAVGDIVIFRSHDGIPIIHRVVQINEQNGARTLQTKGDHNADSISLGPRSELSITQDQYIGTAVAKVPWIGHIKLIFVKAYIWVFNLF